MMLYDAGSRGPGTGSGRWIVLAVLSAALTLGLAAESPMPREGFLDLRAWDGRAPVTLSGTWSFSWPGEPEGAHRHLPVPSNWTTFTGKARAAAVYELEVILPDFGKRLPEGGLAIALPPVNSACELSWNGAVLWSSGSWSSDLSHVVEDKQPGLVSLPPRPGSNTLTLAIANLHDPVAGILEPPRLGGLRDLLSERELARIADCILMGSLIFTGLYHLCLFALRRSDRESLWFALACFLLALRQAYYGGSILLELLPGLSWDAQMRIAYSTFMGSALIIGLFLADLMREAAPRWFRYWIIVGAGGATLAILLLPAWIFVQAFSLFQLYFVASGSLGLWVLARALRRRVPGSALFFGGFLVLFATGVNDTLKPLLALSTPVLSGWGLLGFVFFQSMSLVRKFTKAFEASEALVLDLEQKSAEKEALTRELYHRGIGNMRLVSSYLSLHSGPSGDEPLQAAVADVQLRIASMSLVQGMLYESGDLCLIKLDECVFKIADLVAKRYGRSARPLSITMVADKVTVLIDSAMPCGLILTELIANVYAHAYPGGRVGLINVRLTKATDGLIRLRVSDRGAGMPAGSDPLASEGLGLMTVVGLIQDQLRGRVTFATDTGFSCDISFRDDLYSARV